MARYHVVQWRGIPSLVEAVEGERTARRPLSQRFQDLIDAVAMREGASDSEAYLDGWTQSAARERPGSADTVAQELADELEATFDDLLAKHLLPPR
jgi:hypothetical protein